MTVIKKILTANAVCASFLISGVAHAQHIERQAILSGGSSTVRVKEEPRFPQGLEVDCAVGDIAVKSVNYPDVALLTQGFIQPPLQNLLNLNKDDMILYPNPIATSKNLNILYIMDPLVTKVDVRVISIGGNIMFTDGVVTDNITNFTYTLDVTRFNPGVYVVTLIMNTGIKVSRKFIKFDSQ